MKKLLAILLLCAGVTGYGQNTVIDTIYTENLACGGESFKLLWMPDFGFPEDEWANSLQNLLDQNGFLGASLLDYSYADLQSENCWCWYDPLSAVGSNSGVSCDCCGGETIRPFVDYLVVSIPTNPCAYLSNEISARICNGCTDPSALNFESHASQEDGSCIYSEQQCGDGTIWDDTSQTCIIDETYCSWQPDSDGDQLIGVSDLLMFLSVFGDTDLDQDGIFDSNDDCVGEYDECGVCNGSGPSTPVIESIEILYDSVYAEQIDEWWVFEVGADTTFSYECYWECGMPWDYQGYDYETVQIGEQCWFAENLRSEAFSEGTAIASSLTGENWVSFGLSGIPATAIHGEVHADDALSVSCDTYSPDFNECDPNQALLYYGRLYNWYAASSELGLCPVGWAVPVLADFDVLAQYIQLPEGSFQSQVEGEGFSLMSELFWESSNEGEPTNDYGFSMQPAGEKNFIYGEYNHAGRKGFLWTSEGGVSDAHGTLVSFEKDGQVNISSGSSRNTGHSIRCIKD